MIQNAYLSLLVLFISCLGSDKRQTLPDQTANHLPLHSSAPAQDSFSISYITGKFDPAQHPDFVKVENALSDGGGLYLLRKETYAAFKEMHTAASKAGIKLSIVSATRNFERQKQIWEAKWNGQRLVNNQDLSKTFPDPVQRALKILEYSSMPGTSRHHWGTDIDINSVEPDYFETPQGKKVYDWLSAHASKYGFCQPYSPKGVARPFGYHEEKWHWSYQPIASKLTATAKRHLKNTMIDGFAGAETAAAIGVVEKYILGIHATCD